MIFGLIIVSMLVLAVIASEIKGSRKVSDECLVECVVADEVERFKAAQYKKACHEAALATIEVCRAKTFVDATVTREVAAFKLLKPKRLPIKERITTKRVLEESLGIIGRFIKSRKPVTQAC
jgi:hypothetical protein